MLRFFIVGALLIIFNQIVGNYDSFKESLDTIKTIISPFIYGFVMAYLLCPVYNGTVRVLYRTLGKRFRNKKRIFSICKLIASVVSVICLIGVVAGLSSAGCLSSTSHHAISSSGYRNSEGVCNRRKSTRCLRCSDRSCPLPSLTYGGTGQCKSKHQADEG